MLWLICSFGKPKSEVGEVRKKFNEPHRAYLKSKDHMIFCAGPLQNDDGTENNGSMWIIKANSRAEAEAFSEAEPYTKASVFANVIISRLREGHLHLHPELAGSQCVEYLKKRNPIA